MHSLLGIAAEARQCEAVAAVAYLLDASCPYRRLTDSTVGAPKHELVLPVLEDRHSSVALGL